ncbi:MAG: hypothetical protein HYZ19_00445 [Rhodocyclales bacterium]|nr:hypothetical protein [Rhodocyclales bacterium]
MRIGLLSLAALLLGLALPALAGVALRDRAALEEFLKTGIPCCIIDARSAASRRLAPLANTLVYRKGLKINPTGVVVVVADTDARAVQVGEALAGASKAKDVYAVQGGAATWRAVTGGSAFAGLPRSFVIPKNTCESGVPLQELRTE